MVDFADMDSATLSRALEMVRRLTGITMSPTKQSMLQTRLRPRMRSLQIHTYKDYIQRLSDDVKEHQPFIDAVTTHHTAFFRTPRIWHHISEDFLPAWSEHHAGQTMRAWSAAASSGEEANTIAICCEEHRRRHPALSSFAYEITATDIATETIAKASTGEFTGNSTNAFRSAYPELFKRYNSLDSTEHFQLAENIRKRITFSVHNLLDNSRWRNHFDLIFLRNVLIYFKREDIETIVRNVAPALRMDGLLIIGEAESLAGMDVPFQFKLPQIYRRVAP